MEICNKCHRVKLRAEEEILIMISNGNVFVALEDAHREHRCRDKRLHTIIGGELSMKYALDLLKRGIVL